MSKNEQMVGISRRTLVKSTAIGSLAQCSSSGTTGQRKSGLGCLFRQLW